MNDIEIPIILNVISDTGLLGDINGDLNINIQDVILTVNIILDSLSYNEAADLNTDGSIDVLDVINIVNIILN
mgnify:CR=1 FL=1